MKNLLFLDTETTGIEGARLIQLAVKSSDGHSNFKMEFKPPVPITYEAMAVHHITEKMASKFPSFKPSTAQWLNGVLANGIVVAHNAEFDIGVLEREGVKVKDWICTKKVAQHVWPDFDSHRLQYLRYRLGLEVEAGGAHDAMGDVLVLEAVFEEIMGQMLVTQNVNGHDEAVALMQEWSVKPVLLHKFKFGKHFGKTFEQVAREDAGYLIWLAREGDDEDKRYTAAHWLNKMRSNAV